MSARIKALDLFAGTGWGVACQRLGIKEAGVEIMPEAVATRTANGMETIYHDVWDGLQLTAEQHRNAYGPYGLLIASPPCQTFSLAGKGAGRAALDEVLEAIELHAYKDADALLAFGEQHDMRTALVLSPLAYVWRDRPRLVAFEQVPTVLPVWEACAEVMRDWGYQVKVEVLNAEQYGVPQTRKRAILVARRGGPVNLPAPTHSRYYSRTPDKLDPGVLKWVSMAEALGWGGDELTICHGVQKNSARRPMTEPAGTIAFGHDSASVGFAPASVGDHIALRDAKRNGDFQRITIDQAAAIQSYPAAVVRTSMGKPKVDDRNGSHELDPFNRPAHTLTSKSESWLIKEAGAGWDAAEKLTADEAAALQSYPTGRGLTNKPSPTIVGTSGNGGGQPLMKFRERCTSDPAWVGSTNPLTVEEAAALQSYPSGRGLPNRPSPSVISGGSETGGAEPISYFQRYTTDPAWIGTTERLHVDEVAALQTYEPPFVWCGTKTKQFLQIGNAVPPLLAEHILAALIGIKAGR
jgi:DNA (cytosine-5)-methyltransferase 1